MPLWPNKNVSYIFCTSSISNSGMKMQSEACHWQQLSTNAFIRQTFGSKKTFAVRRHSLAGFQRWLTPAASFFAVQHARTAFLDTTDVAKLRKHSKKRASGHHSESQIREAVKTYNFLLYPSVECIPKSFRNDFLRRAVVLDFLLGSAPSVSTHRAFAVVRTFLARTFSFLGSWEHESSRQYLHYLMTSPVPIYIEQVTMDLVQGHLR